MASRCVLSEVRIAVPRQGGQKGKWLRGLAPHGHWRRLTLPGALRRGRLEALRVRPPIYGQCFRGAGLVISISL